MHIAVGTCSVIGPRRIADQTSIETEVAGHSRRGLNAMVGRGAANDQRFDACAAQSCLQIGTDESAVHTLHDHRLAGHFTRFVLDDIPPARNEEFGRVPSWRMWKIGAP
jgi:hypothetical protein